MTGSPLWWCALGAFVALRIALQFGHAKAMAVPPLLTRLTSVASVHVENGVLHSRELFKHQSIALRDMQTVEYAYSAVVGHVGVWIFTARSGEEVAVGRLRTGIARVLKALEQELPPFTIAHWQQAFADGDVEDTLLLWTRPGGAEAAPQGQLPTR